MKSLLILLLAACWSKAEESRVPTMPEGTPPDCRLVIQWIGSSERGRVVLNEEQSRKLMAMLCSEGPSLIFQEPPIAAIIESRHGRYAEPVFTCPRGVIYRSEKGEEKAEDNQQVPVAFLDEKMMPLHFTLLDLYSRKTKEQVREQLLELTRIAE